VGGKKMRTIIFVLGLLTIQLFALKWGFAISGDINRLANFVVIFSVVLDVVDMVIKGAKS
jgi:hypothetical protein